MLIEQEVRSSGVLYQSDRGGDDIHQIPLEMDIADKSENAIVRIDWAGFPAWMRVESRRYRFKIASVWCVP